MADINTTTWKEVGKMVKRASRAGATALQTAFNMTFNMSIITHNHQRGLKHCKYTYDSLLFT